MKFLDKMLRRAAPDTGKTVDTLLEFAERKEWMESRGFRLVFDPFTRRYVPGFDRDEEYEFMRPDWESPHVFRMSDQHPAFNIAGLSFRAIDLRR